MKLKVMAAKAQRMTVKAMSALRALAGNLDVRDVITFGGLALVGAGLNAVYPPAAAIVCGCALFWLGVR